MKLAQTGQDLVNKTLAPAFTVKDDMILHVNQEAAQLQLAPGMELPPLLYYYMDDYHAFAGGRLYMAMSVDHKRVGVTVTRFPDYDLFMIDTNSQIRLQMLSLAAKELRGKFSEIFFITERIRLTGEMPEGKMLAAYMQSSMKMQRLISNMADAAEYEKGVTADRTVVNLTSLFDEVFEKTSALMGDNGPKLIYHSLSEPVVTLADPQKLRRAAYNLLSNAIKFSPKDGVVEAWLKKNGSQLQLIVQDSGQGVPEHIQANLFTRYQRPPCIEEGRQGLGIGLMLVRCIALMHEGTVLLQQSLGKGARISFSVSLQQLPPCKLYSHPLVINYTGGEDQALLELSDVLPIEAYA